MVSYKIQSIIFLASCVGSLLALEGPAMQQHIERMEKLRKRVWSEPGLRALWEEREQLHAKVNELGRRDIPEVKQMLQRIKEITQQLRIQLGLSAPWEII